MGIQEDDRIYKSRKKGGIASSLMFPKRTFFWLSVFVNQDIQKQLSLPGGSQQIQSQLPSGKMP